MEKFKRASDDAGKSGQSFDSMLKAISPSALTAMAGVTALVKGIQGLVSAGKGIVDMASHFEQTQKGLETVLQSAEKGKKLFESLRKFSFQTTFGVDELASASTQLLNVGEATEDLQKDLKMLGDLAQGDKAKFAELTSIFAKIKSTGKASSMQLQQLAMRGIPINQTLKEMGVKGVASVSDLTKAFKKLTEEGGQFHNAMENINDTIEGKRGFISDTMKELAVNLGDASGLTDAYKGALDVIYNKIQDISDWLQEISENPVSKAVFSGVLVTLIAGIGIAILTNVVPALITTITQLGIVKGLMDAISLNPIGLILTAVGALAVGIGVAVSTLNDENQTASATIRTLEDEIKELRELQSEKGNLSGSESVDLFSKEVEKAKLELQELEKSRELLLGNNQTKGYADQQQKIIDKKKAELEQYIKLLDMNKKMVSQDTQRYNAIKSTVDLLNGEYKDAVDDINNRWGNTAQGQLEKVQEELQKYEKISKGMGKAEIQQLGNGQSTIVYSQGFSDEEMKKANRILAGIQKDLKDKQLKVVVDDVNTKMTDYQSKLLSIMGMSEDEFVKSQMKYDSKEGKWIPKSDYSLVQQDVNGQWHANIGTATPLDFIKSGNYQFSKLLTLGGLEGALYGNGSASKSSFIQSQLESTRSALQEIVNYADIDKKTGELKVNQSALESYIKKINELNKEFSASKLEDVKKYNSDTQKWIEEQRQAGLSLAEIAEKRALLDMGILEDEQEQFKEAQKVQETLQGMLSGVSGLADWIEKNKTLSDGQRAGLNAVNSVISGSDAGTFVDTLISKGSVWSAILETLFSAIAKVVGGMEGISLVLNAVTDALKELEPLFKTVFLLLYILVLPLKPIAEWLMKFLNWITGGFFDDMASTWDSLVASQKKESDAIKDLVGEMENLKSAMTEQEEYYIAMKKQINSDTYRDSTYKVNDMILTPNGTFSTHPEDTIFAMKHPEDLMNGGGVVMIQPIINNSMSDSADVSVQQRTNEKGMTELIVNISKKIASDVARGVNGWDSALAQRNARIEGVSRF